MPNSLTMNMALTVQGFKGESIADDKVWILKTHFPEWAPPHLKISATKSVVVVRNPLDVAVSMFQMGVTQTHTKSCNNEINKEFEEDWEWMVKNRSEAWNFFYEYWLDLAKNKNVPVYFVRFEDLLTNPAYECKLALEFLLGVESFEGTYMEQRIEQCLSGEGSGVVYKPRSGKFNANLKYYNEE